MARELCSIVPGAVAALLPALTDVTRLTHFPQADTARATFFAALPGMVAAIGKAASKPYMEALLEPLFATLTRPTTHQLAGYAAVDCVQQLSLFLGPGIFMGRLSDEQAAVMKKLPSTIAKRRTAEWTTAYTCTTSSQVALLLHYNLKFAQRHICAKVADDMQHSIVHRDCLQCHSCS